MRKTLPVHIVNREYGRQEAAKRGRAPGRTAYGYARVQKKYVIAVEPGSVVLAVYICFAYGAASSRVTGRFSIVEFGELLHRNPRWIYRLLQNRTYLGEFRWGSILVQGHHAAIVPIKLFDRVQSSLLPVRKYAKADAKMHRAQQLKRYYERFQPCAKEWLEQHSRDRFSPLPITEFLTHFELKEWVIQAKGT